MRPTGLLKDTTELRKLIAEHPNYPICVSASEDANNGDYGWTYCARVSFAVGEILDCEQHINDEIVFDDRDDFEQRLDEWLWDEMCCEVSCYGMYDRKPTEEQFQKRLAEEKAKYEPYWKDCIFIYADN